ncbi:MAG TPA: alginate export family protein [Candidatus Hydrogenedentes bacterium]|nr:alginate export family protein [Candidatus Hydrogenedentota bacterium]
MHSLMKVTVLAALVVCMGVGAYAELQNVSVGGNIRIRGNVWEADEADVLDTAFVEQRTRLSVKADFTDNVSALIELDSYDIWGEDFRSNYITGVDGRAASGDDVEVYQAYIEASEMWDTPLMMRVGRQELQFGSEWLLGNNDTSALFRGLSYDALLLNYGTDIVSISAFAAKLNETFSDFGDDDVDLYGIYGSYLGLEDVVIDAYWLFIRDDESLTNADIDLHTIGLRGAGEIGAFDFEAEVAYQFGEWDLPGFLWWDNDADIDAFGVNLELGYTFDASWQPRIYLGAAWFEGGDQDNGWGWWNDDDDLAFNRLFSDWEYTEVLDNVSAANLSNVFIYRAGLSVKPTESLDLALALTYLEVDEELEGGWWFWRWTADEDLGLEVGLYANYQYSEDLVFRAGWAHLFADDGIEEGNLVGLNGLAPLVADEDEDIDYLFLETEIRF